MYKIKNEEFDRVYEIMKASFIESELRMYSDLKKLFDEEEIIIYGYQENNLLVGVFFCWELPSCLFLESFAIDEKYRNHGIGSIMLRALQRKYINKLLVLEVEDPFDEISAKRISFYRRNDFHLSEFGYMLPKLNKEISKIPLLIMSYPYLISELEYKKLKKEIFDIVYKVEI